MTYEQVIQYCKNKKNVEEDYPFGETPLVMKVFDKMFVLISEASTASISLKCEEIFAQQLRIQFPAITPGYHLNKKYWNTIELDGSIEDDFLKFLIDHSYDEVLKKMPKSKKVF